MTEEQILVQIDLITQEMKSLGYWSNSGPPEMDHQKLYSGASFENWLQFVYLPSLSSSLEKKTVDFLPQYRVGLAAFRNYDYMSPVEEASRLLEHLQKLEIMVVNWAISETVLGDKKVKDWYQDQRNL